MKIKKNDIAALENKNDQMRLDVNSIKEKCQADIKNCFEEITTIRNAKEESEQKYIEKLEEMNGIIKKYQNKIFEQESAYKELCESSSNKLKETYDKFTNEIKNIKNNHNEYDYDNISNSSVTEMSLEIHNLKNENIEIKNKLEKSQSDFNKIQRELNEQRDKHSNFVKLEKDYKNRIKELEEENENLRADILNSSMNEKEGETAGNVGDIGDNENKKNDIIKQNIEMKKENEKLQKYIISSEFRNALAMKINFENKKLKEEINMYKKEIEKLTKKSRDSNNNVK
jgi:chromosome segregation ATPase